MRLQKHMSMTTPYRIRILSRRVCDNELKKNNKKLWCLSQSSIHHTSIKSLLLLKRVKWTIHPSVW
jgi:hypothetical protein